MFFVISGFVIARVALQQDCRTFVFLRISRIYPIYWFYLGLTVGFFKFWQSHTFSTAELLPAILLVPSSSAPIVPVAWSLIYEVYFYAVVSLFIAARIELRSAYLAWAIITATIWIFDSSAFLGSVNTLEFIAGGLLSFFAGGWTDSKLLKLNCPRWIEALGDASYSIYLCHFLLIATLGRLLFSAGLTGWIITAVLSLVMANFAGLASYHWLEKPILRFARIVRNRWA
ncbi:acyltransferase family protein [Rhodopseudomonas sp. P2A-2r]|uniref:acyltransferase family protein n=1 Tax=Rhodopseudomonas sp. P2A-2r TaxID=2991972 RepID=UPI002234012D|nr:acyltransferase family protein [Rhodopseudomonas sp. P2A-2r]UZE46955.1 acyltransferase family protein [Rhodopseudomonas sp. P2A-2r]